MSLPSPPSPSLPSPQGRPLNGAAAAGVDDTAMHSLHESVDAQAAAWWLRYREGHLENAHSEAAHAFQHWLAARPEHGAAWQGTLRTAQALDELPDAAVETLRVLARAAARTPAAPRAEPAEPASMPASGQAARRQRRGFVAQAVAAGIAVAVLGGGAWFAVDRYLQQPTFMQSYATQRGQFLDIALPDGTRLNLDTASQVQVTLYRQRREVRLAQGQAMFSVAPDAQRPFRVQAGAIRVTVVGTRFQVRHVDETVSVQVEEGKVRVQSASSEVGDIASAMPAALLVAGDAVRADAAGRLSAVSAVAAGAVAPWRGGRLNFDNTPLTEALAEFARYGDTRLLLRDPAVGALRITGSFEIARAGSFAQTLPQVLPVRMREQDGQTEIVAR